MDPSSAIQYRQEWKHEIGLPDHLILRQRLSAVAKPDPYAQNGSYTVRSLYFDTAQDTALREKLDGVRCREKFRIRLYNGDSSLIRLEKKSKVGSLCHKDSVPLTREQAVALSRGEYFWMAQTDVPLIAELYVKMLHQGLRPRTIVEYTREPFVFHPGNVRVTLDYDLRTGLDCTELLDPVTVPVPSPIILEVKWDEFLPDVIRNALQLGTCRAGAFSKYAACRTLG